MDRQATQPAAVPSGRKRRRVSSKKPKEEAPALDLKAVRELEMKATHDLEMTQIGLSRPEAEALEKKVLQDPSSELSVALKALSRAELLDRKATQPPTSELMVALKALPRAEDPPPTPYITLPSNPSYT